MVCANSNLVDIEKVEIAIGAILSTLAVAASDCSCSKTLFAILFCALRCSLGA